MSSGCLRFLPSTVSPPHEMSHRQMTSDDVFSGSPSAKETSPSEVWKLRFFQLSHEKNTAVGWVFFGDEILPSYVRDYFINHYFWISSLNNQYFMKSKGPRFFLTVAQLFW